MVTDWKRGDNLKESCKLCGGILVIRQSSRDGSLFVGCRSFPSCRFSRKIRPGDEREGGQWGEKSGYLCAVCREPQYNTPSGIVCKNGHGGVDSIDPDTGEVVDRGFDEIPPVEEEDVDPFAVNDGPAPAETTELQAAGCEAEVVDAASGLSLDEDIAKRLAENPDVAGRYAEKPIDEDLYTEGRVVVDVTVEEEQEDAGPSTSVPTFESAMAVTDNVLEIEMVSGSSMLMAGFPRRGAMSDSFDVGFDRDALRRRAEAGHDVAAEMLGHLLPSLLKALRKVL